MDPEEQVIPITIIPSTSTERVLKLFAIKDTAVNLYRTDALPTAIDAWSNCRDGAQKFKTAKAAQAALYSMWAERICNNKADERVKRERRPMPENAFRSYSWPFKPFYSHVM